MSRAGPGVPSITPCSVHRWLHSRQHGSSQQWCDHLKSLTRMWSSWDHQSWKDSAVFLPTNHSSTFSHSRIPVQLQRSGHFLSQVSCSSCQRGVSKNVSHNSSLWHVRFLLVLLGTFSSILRWIIKSGWPLVCPLASVLSEDDLVEPHQHLTVTREQPDDKRQKEKMRGTLPLISAEPLN